MIYVNKNPFLLKKKEKNKRKVKKEKMLCELMMQILFHLN